MARRTFDVVDVTEILIHWHAGRSQRELAASLGVDPKTVRKYVAPAIAAGLAPGAPPLPPARWAELVGEWFPQLADTTLRQVSWPAIAVHHEAIRALLGEVSVSTIHQRLRDALIGPRRGVGATGLLDVLRTPGLLGLGRPRGPSGSATGAFRPLTLLDVLRRPRTGRTGSP